MDDQKDAAASVRSFFNQLIFPLRNLRGLEDLPPGLGPLS
jgi:hypothetical protein